MVQQKDQTGVTLQGSTCPGKGTHQQHGYYPEHTPLAEPISPILPRDHPLDDDVVGSILRDPNIDQGLLGAAISQLPPHLSSRFVPQRSALLSHGPGSAENPQQVLPQQQASAPPPESTTPNNMSHKLVEENIRLRKKCDRFKKDLDGQHKIDLACQKKLKRGNMSRKHKTQLPSSDRTWTIPKDLWTIGWLRQRHCNTRQRH